MQKPSIMPGFMELKPSEQLEFNRIVDVIRTTYEDFGFQPIDTPIIEKTEVLLAKENGETSKQVYKIEDKGGVMRFDLTVPLARYVAMNVNELTFPFKRYQIGKVYRAERNQAGRFREFYQADIDIIGDGSLGIVNDAEIPAIIYSLFTKLGIGAFVIRINNRKILRGFFDSIGVEDSAEVLRTLDKFDKIGLEAVKEELRQTLNDATIEKILAFINIKGTKAEIIAQLGKLEENELLKQGIEEISLVSKYLGLFNIPEAAVEIDLKIARGLDYYTGTVYETFLLDYENLGSICSGGRYEDLASLYCKKNLPGVGISIGVTRLFYLLREAGILNFGRSCLTEVLIVPMDTQLLDASLALAGTLRSAGIRVEVYSEECKFKKKLDYGNKLGIPYAVIVGEDEVATGIYPLKNMTTGEQEKLSVSDMTNRLIIA